jgi:thiamine biosynthesis lipoprotein
MPGPFRRQCRPALGTLVEIALHEDDLPVDAADQQAVFDAAFARIEQVQRQMSFHDPDSVLSRINRVAPNSRIEVPQQTREVLGIALRIHLATGGLFDCGVGGHLVRARLLPNHCAAPGAPAGGGLGQLCLDADGGVIVRQRVCLDLGGIAKGFAVDQAVEMIGAMGVARRIVNAGGDLRVAGGFAEPIVVRRPDVPGMFVPLGELADGAIATSAPYFSAQGEGTAQRCALFDPVGISLVARRSYTVVAPTCVLADALTKAVAVAYHRQSDDSMAAMAVCSFKAFQADFLNTLNAQAFIL